MIMYSQKYLASHTRVLRDIVFPELRYDGLLHQDIEFIDFREMQLILYKFSEYSKLSDEDKRLALYVMKRRMRHMIIPNIIGILQRESLLANGAQYPAYSFPHLAFLSDSSIKHLENYRKIPDDPIWSYYESHGREITANAIVRRMKDGTLTSALEERAHDFDEATNGGPMTQPQTCSKAVKKAAKYTHYAVAFDSFQEALLYLCAHPVYAICTYDDPVDQLDKYNGKWYVRNMPRHMTTT